MEQTIILVTGGNQGIGRAIVETLVQKGSTVAFTYFSNQSAAQELLEKCCGKAKAFQMDLRDRNRPDELVAEIEKFLGPIEGLVNNAGIQKEMLLGMTSDDNWDAVLDTNLGGTFRCCRAVLPRMIHRRKGSIVNISSLSALHAISGQASYAASKAGIIGLTKVLAREVGKRGIRVNAVLPGFVKTNLTAKIPPEKVTTLRAVEVLPSGVNPFSISKAVFFLLSDQASSITGHSLVVDAGSSS